MKIKLEKCPQCGSVLVECTDTETNNYLKEILNYIEHEQQITIERIAEIQLENEEATKSMIENLFKKIQEKNSEEPVETLNFREKLEKAGFKGKHLENGIKILNELNQNITNPYSSKELYDILQKDITSVCGVTNCLKALREENFVKIVKYEETGSSVKIFHQLKESPLEEINVKTEGEEYSSISNFFKNTALYSTAIRTLVARKLRSMNEPTFLVQHKEGFYMGYRTSTLKKIAEEIGGNQTSQESSEQLKLNYESIDEEFTEVAEKSLRQQIVELFKKDLNRGYSSSEIARLFNTSICSASSVLRATTKAKLMKVVAINPNEKERYAFKYQLKESPLKEVRIKQYQNTITLKDFCNRNKKNLKVKNYRDIQNLLTKENVKYYPIYKNNTLCKGYKENDLNRLLLIKEPKRVQSKQKIATETVEVKTEKQGIFSSLFKAFKKKEKNNSSSEIIYF